MVDRLEVRALLATAVHDGIMKTTHLSQRNGVQYWYFTKTNPVTEENKNE